MLRCSGSADQEQRFNLEVDVLHLHSAAQRRAAAPRSRVSEDSDANESESADVLH